MSNGGFGLAKYGIRSQGDYISRYRRILEHFDSVQIGPGSFQRQVCLTPSTISSQVCIAKVAP